MSWSDFSWCGTGEGDWCHREPGDSWWSVARQDTRCLLTAGPLAGHQDSGPWECNLVRRGVSNTSSLDRQEISSSRVRLEPPGDLTLTAGEEVSWTCEPSATVNTPPSSHWTVGTTRYPGNGSVTSNIQMNGVKVIIATIEIQTFPVSEQTLYIPMKIIFLDS